MAVEGLVLVHPTDSTKNVTLNGTKWGLEELDLGNPPRRDELVGSLDASGASPFRVAPRENREVTFTIRLLDASTMNAALDSIAALESVLEAAERFASSDPNDPVLDHVRLVYTPAGSTYSYSLIVYTAEIADLPRTLEGDDAGWFIKRPVVTVKATCDPFAYGAGVTSPTRTTWLTTTVSGSAADSKTIPASGAIAGDVPPWTRVRLEDKQTQARNRVILGVRQGENAVTPTIGAASLTAVSGTVSSGTMTTTSTDWTVAGQLPRQTRPGTFRVLLVGASSASTGSARFISAPAGSSRRTGPTAELVSGSAGDADLGEVAIDSAWDGWIETRGSVLFTGVVLIPTDSYVDVTSPAPGRQLVGAVQIADTLRTTSTSINNRSFTTGSGTWSNASGSWPVSSADWARRTATSMTDPTFAFAGTTDYMDVDVRARVRRGGANIGFSNRSIGFGIFLRRDATAGAYLVLYYSSLLKRFTFTKIFGTGGTDYVDIWTADHNDSLGFSYDIQAQVTSDGRWYVSVKNVDGPAFFAEGLGQDKALAAGGLYGNTTAARVGLYDFHDGTGTVTRDTSNFQVSALTGITPSPIPSGGELKLAGPKLLTSDNSEHPYTGSSGVHLRPGANNNLTTLVRHPSTASAQVLDVTVDGWPRYLAVPHG